jgi:hypothetical protein
VSWTLTVRAGPRVERSRFDDLSQALEALEARAAELASELRGRPVSAAYTRFDPSEQVAARLELAGPERLLPSARAGVDLRGDGSVQAYRGRIRRAAVQRRRGETSYEALRRVLSAN